MHTVNNKQHNLYSIRPRADRIKSNRTTAHIDTGSEVLKVATTHKCLDTHTYVKRSLLNCALLKVMLTGKSSSIKSEFRNQKITY